MNAKQNHVYEQRLKRFQMLIELRAPHRIVAREAILIAAALVKPDEKVTALIPFILTEFSDDIPGQN